MDEALGQSDGEALLAHGRDRVYDVAFGTDRRHLEAENRREG